MNGMENGQTFLLTETWFDAYAKQIKNIRDAGLDHQLIVDTCGWGQDPSCVYNYGEELLKVDNNVVFSAHVYDSLGDSEYKLGRMYHLLDIIKFHLS